MARLLINGVELEVTEDLESVLGLINAAEREGPQEAGRRVLPAGWVILHTADRARFVQTSQIGWVAA